MFWKRKAASPKPQGDNADRELEALRADLTRRQERIAQLELDLLGSHGELAAFNAEIEQRLGPLQRRLEALEAELADARRRVSRRTLWGDRASSSDVPEDVTAQYQRIWGRDAGPAPTPPLSNETPAASPIEADLKSLYRSLAKRFHPDLAADPTEKPRREQMMARVNEAYRSQDLAALQKLAGEAAPEAPAAPKTREQIMVELRSEIERLDQVAASLEQQLDALAKSPAVQLKLEALWARRAGGDLLSDMGRQLAADIQRAEKELASLR